MFLSYCKDLCQNHVGALEDLNNGQNKADFNFTDGSIHKFFVLPIFQKTRPFLFRVLNKKTRSSKEVTM